jgi:hypothetical protein
MGRKFCFTDNLLFGVTTGLYSVAVFVFGQQPELVAADIPAMGQPLGAASPAQHGLVQSGGQTFGQQPGLASPAQHGLAHPDGLAFGQQPVADFSAEHTSAFSAKKALAAGHDVPPAAGQVLACEPAPDRAGKMFA